MADSVTGKIMASSLQSMVVSGSGVLTCPLEDFAEALVERFQGHVQLISQDESPREMKWSIRCILQATDHPTIAEIKDYLEIYFPSDSGELQIDSSAYPLFDVMPDVFFVVNRSSEADVCVDVQYVDRWGRTRKSRSLSSASNTGLGEPPIPEAVFAAGLRCPSGMGDYVDLNGRRVSPADFS